MESFLHRSARGALVPGLLLLCVLLTGGGCAFDSEAIQGLERCSRDADCAEGLCVGGRCLDASTPSRGSGSLDPETPATGVLPPSETRIPGTSPTTEIPGTTTTPPPPSTSSATGVVRPGSTVPSTVSPGSDGLCADGEPPRTFWRDADGDGFGDPERSVVSCVAPEGWVDRAGDCDDTDSEVNPDAVDIPDGRNIDRNCDGVVGDRARAVFVSPSGDDGAAGTAEDPVDSLERALELARAEGRDHIYVQEGRWAGPIALQGGEDLAIYGGYDAQWQRPESGRSTIESATPRALVLREIEGGLRLDGWVLEAADATEELRSSVSLWIEDVRDPVLLERLELIAGRGWDGADSSTPPRPPRSASGGTPTAGCLVEVSRSVTGNLSNPRCFDTGATGAAYDATGRGGTSVNDTCDTPANPFGAGGRGGDGGLRLSSGGETLNNNGQSGEQVDAAAGGGGGAASTCNNNASPGSDGADGERGAGGEPGVRPPDQREGRFMNDDWRAGDGASGTPGQQGFGGAGGGGGGSRGLCGSGGTRYFQRGGGGGGGGVGGCGGRSGLGGEGGGGSIGVVVRAAPRVEARDLIVRTSDAGDGGVGAPRGPGGPGGLGAPGALGGQSEGNLGNGGRGGAGGEGGNGGAGGAASGGAGGSSVAFLLEEGIEFVTEDVQTELGEAGEAGAGGGGNNPFRAEPGEPGVRQLTLRVPLP